MTYSKLKLLNRACCRKIKTLRQVQKNEIYLNEDITIWGRYKRNLQIYILGKSGGGKTTTAAIILDQVDNTLFFVAGMDDFKKEKIVSLGLTNWKTTRLEKIRINAREITTRFITCLRKDTTKAGIAFRGNIRTFALMKEKEKTCDALKKLFKDSRRMEEFDVIKKILSPKDDALPLCEQMKGKTAIDLSGSDPTDLKLALLLSCLIPAWDKYIRGRKKELFWLGFDEIPTFATPRTPVGEAIAMVSREGRKFGISAVYMSQEVTRLHPSIRSNVTDKIIHDSEVTDLRRLEREFGIKLKKQDFLNILGVQTFPKHSFYYYSSKVSKILSKANFYYQDLKQQTKEYFEQVRHVRKVETKGFFEKNLFKRKIKTLTN